MNRYNHHFANHFGSCRLLANARDPHRNRDVQIRMIPGEFEFVGITDGVDAWVAPVAGDPFSVNIARILDDIRQGRALAQRPDTPLKRRSPSLTPADAQQTPLLRRRPTADTVPTPTIKLRRR